MIYVGLDVGKKNDNSALSCFAKSSQRLIINHLHRYHLGTPYPAMVAQVTKLLNMIGDATLMIDNTGGGIVVTDMFRMLHAQKKLSARVVAINISGGAKVTMVNEDEYSVPKSILAKTTHQLLREKKIGISQRLPEARSLKTEFGRFQQRINQRGHAQYAADWKSGTSDDLLLSVLIGAWGAVNL